MYETREIYLPQMILSALDAGESPAGLNADRLIPAIQAVGRMYETREIYLPQMILSAETMQKALAVLEPRMGDGSRSLMGTVVICTVRGDVHDIGKNLVSLFLRNRGFRVVDLGKDVPADVIVGRASEAGADFVALSALMTTTMTEMPGVVRALRDSGSREYADAIGADGFAADGVAAADLLAAWSDSNRNEGNPK